MLYQDFDLTLNGSRIRITPMTAADAEPYARLMFGSNYDRFVSLLGSEAVETDLPQVLDKTADHEVHAIRPLDSDTFLGWIVLQHDGDKPDIGIHLIPEMQGQGLGPEVVRLYSGHLNQVYGINRIYMRTTQGNVHSQRMIEKLGGVYDGTGVFPIEGVDFNMLQYHLDLPKQENYDIKDRKDRAI